MRKLQEGSDASSEVSESDEAGKKRKMLMASKVVDTVNGSALYKFERFFVYVQFLSVILSIDIAWPSAFKTIWSFTDLSHEWFVWFFQIGFSLFDTEDNALRDYTDLQANFFEDHSTISNYILKLLCVAILLFLLFSFWVIRDYTDPVYTDKWIAKYVTYWWNILFVWKSGVGLALVRTAIAEGLLIGFGTLLLVVSPPEVAWAVMVGGSIFILTFLLAFVFIIQVIRIVLKSHTKNNTYYTTRIMMKRIVESKVSFLGVLFPRIQHKNVSSIRPKKAAILTRPRPLFLVVAPSYLSLSLSLSNLRTGFVSSCLLRRTCRRVSAF